MMNNKEHAVGMSIENGEDASNDEAKSMINNEQEVSRSIENGQDDSDDESPSSLDPIPGPQEEERTEPCISHFRNKEAHSFLWRYGMPVYLLGTVGLLLASHLGSGVAAEYILFYPDGTLFEQKTLFVASIFTSVNELWDTGSYALVILIVIASILWPYVKLFLTLAAWMFPYRSHGRRERHLEIIDALGKWSFIDIFVLLIIMVAFRATIEVGQGAYMEVVVVPRWGFYAFTLDTMLSLLGTQVVLYLHRRLISDDGDAVSRTDDEEVGQGGPTLGKQPLVATAKVRMIVMLLLLASTLALVIVGCVMNVFEVTNSQAGVTVPTVYSVLSVGSRVASASLEPNSIGVRWIQAMYFFLGFALPLWTLVMFAVLYLFPMTAQWHKRVFMLAEITFSWSSIEVLSISIVFSVLQIPSFGNGLIKSGCANCYQVDSSIFPEFAVLAVASALHMAVSIWLYRQAHEALYHRL